MNDPPRGFAHHHTDEELCAYAALTPEQKLAWLHEAGASRPTSSPPSGARRG